MRIHRFVPLAAIVAGGLFLVGCSDDKGAEGAASASAAVSAAPAASGSVGPGDGSGQGDGSGRDDKDQEARKDKCPNTVEGAKTTIEDTDKGVIVTVVAEGDGKIAEVRERAKFVVAENEKDQKSERVHDGSGGGGGRLGKCPIVLRDTIVVAEDVEGGSKFTVEAKNAEEVDGLRRETKQRQAKIEAG